MSHLVRDLEDYSEEYCASFDERINEKMNREWTQSQHVRDAFRLLDEIFKFSDIEPISGKSLHASSYDYTLYGAGFIDPHDGRNSTPRGYKARATTAKGKRPWDFRYQRSTSREEYTESLSITGYKRHYDGKAVDEPACYFDYGSTIFVVDMPQLIDIIVKSGEYKMPKCAKNEVFLAMTPEFVKAHPEMEAILFAADADGELFDIRKWYNNGTIERIDLKVSYRPYKYVWHGKVPDEIVEMRLANRLSDIVSATRGSVIKGYNEDKWGSVKDVQSCVNLADALMMQKGYIEFPSLKKGKKISSNGTWKKWSEDNHVDFADHKMSDEMRAIAAKLDELSDVSGFWKRAHDDFRIAVLLDEKDFRRADFVFDKFSSIGKLLGVDNYIETYEAGVPAEDILA